jgi:hypothetical protein
LYHYPFTGPSSVDFVSGTSEQCHYLWTDGVHDCVVIVGLHVEEKRAVLSHINWQCSLDTLMLALAKEVGRHPRWCVLTSQLSPFAVRVLNRLRRLNPTEPVLVYAPDWVLRQQGWRSEPKNKRAVYIKQYFNPDAADVPGGSFDTLTTQPIAVIVDVKRGKVHVSTDMCPEPYHFERKKREDAAKATAATVAVAAAAAAGV